MKNALANLVEILPWISNNPGVSATEVASHFNIRKNDVLDLLQVAVFTGPGQGGGELVDIDFYDEDSLQVMDAKGLDRPLKFSPEKSLEIIGGLQYLMQLPGVVDTEALESLVAKLQDSFELDVAPIEISNSARQDEIAKLLGQAITEKLAVEIEYSSGNTGRVTQRVIDPRSLSIQENIRYVQAWCHAALDLRFFRIDRIKSAKILSKQQVNKELEEQRISVGSHHVTLRCTTPALLDINPELIVQKTTISENLTEIQILVHDLNWIARQILASSGALTAVGPKALTDLLNDKIAKWHKLNSID